MYQVTFSDQSISELNKLPKEEQMVLVEKLSSIKAESFGGNSNDIGTFQRENKTLYRLRAENYRVYFELKDQKTLFCHYILEQHTLKDFIIRFKLPISEEQMLEDHQSFWKYLETLKNN